jgi:hypothetical protein
VKKREKLAQARQLAEELTAVCEEMGHPLASNYVHLGLSLLEERVEPWGVREIPTDFPKIEKKIPPKSE